MNDPVTASAIGQAAVPLVLIVVALLAVRGWLSRGGGPAPRRAVRVVSRTGLTKGAVVAIVAVGHRRLLVGASEHGVSLLTELDPEEALEDEGHASTHHDAATEVMTPLAGRGRGPASTDGRPWMGPVHRLQQLTVRQAVPPHPRRPSRDRAM